MLNKYAILVVAIIFLILAFLVKPVFEVTGWNLPDKTLNIVSGILGIFALCVSLVAAVIAFKK